ncbi:MAG: class I SAM-dependent methyltransferase [Minisyncoccota bacterium]
MDAGLKWKKYQKRTADGKPRPLLVEALSYLSKKDAVLDIGAGALNDTQFLLGHGFREIIAVDITPQFKELFVPKNVQFTYIQKRLEEYPFPLDYFDLISAQYTLPFISKDYFEKIWTHIRRSLRVGGIFAGQLFGERDDWFGRNTMSFYTADEVTKFTDGFASLVCNEREYTEEADRNKHWHYFDLILKKEPAHE